MCMVLIDKRAHEGKRSSGGNENDEVNVQHPSVLHLPSTVVGIVASVAPTCTNLRRRCFPSARFNVPRLLRCKRSSSRLHIIHAGLQTKGKTVQFDQADALLRRLRHSWRCSSLLDRCKIVLCRSELQQVLPVNTYKGLT